MRKLAIFLSVIALSALGACSDKTVTGSIPLPEHPRPDFERSEWVNLNGHWAFTFDQQAAETAISTGDFSAMDKKILVPFPWGSKLSEVEDGGDIGWYGREITVPKSWKGKRVFLVVGASDWDTQVLLDGKEIGTSTESKVTAMPVVFGRRSILRPEVRTTSNLYISLLTSTTLPSRWTLPWLRPRLPVNPSNWPSRPVGRTHSRVISKARTKLLS